MRIGLYLAKLAETPPAESSVFTAVERRYCLRRRHPEPHLAGRYAAKKAVGIALSLDGEIPLGDIEVERRAGRAPTILLRGRAAQSARLSGTARTHLSISHSGDYAVALVVVE